MLKSKFYKQVYGCPIEGPLSVIFLIFTLLKQKEKLVEPNKAPFYKRFVDVIINKQYKNNQTISFKHPILIIQRTNTLLKRILINFLTKIIQKNGVAMTKVNQKDK